MKFEGEKGENFFRSTLMDWTRKVNPVTRKRMTSRRPAGLSRIAEPPNPNAQIVADLSN
jgi:hypothetical protein